MIFIGLVVFESFPSIFIFLTPDILLLTRPVLDLNFFMGSVNIQGIFDADFFYFCNLTILKLSIVMLDHVTEMLGNTCILLHGTPFPFSGNQIYIYYKFKFFVFMSLAPECYWSPAPGACPDLADQRGCGRPVIPWGRGWSGGCGSCGLANPGGPEEACDYFHVSNFSVVVKSFSL